MIELPEAYKDSLPYEPTLYIALDRGSMGRPVPMFYHGGALLRVIVIFDFAHIFALLLSCLEEQMDMKADKTEANIAYNVFIDPFYGPRLLAPIHKLCFIHAEDFANARRPLL